MYSCAQSGDVEDCLICRIGPFLRLQSKQAVIVPLLKTRGLRCVADERYGDLSAQPFSRQTSLFSRGGVGLWDPDFSPRFCDSLCFLWIKLRTPRWAVGGGRWDGSGIYRSKMPYNNNIPAYYSNFNNGASSSIVQMPSSLRLDLEYYYC
jgi:hypothetical protein